MNALQRTARAALGAATLSLAALPAFGDGGASQQEIRAMKARLQQSPPKPADYSAQPYPGAEIDLDCSADQSANRQPNMMAYCYYTRDPYEKVDAFLKGPGRPTNGVRATADRGDYAVGGLVKIPNVTRLTYFVNLKAKAFHEGFPAEPPPAAELVAPLYPGSTYDKECSAAMSFEALSKPKWRRVYCYATTDPAPTVSKAFPNEYKNSTRHGVQLDIVKVRGTPAVTQIQYWLVAGATPAPAAAPGPRSDASPAAPSSDAAGMPLQAAAAAPAPAVAPMAKPAAPDAAAQAADAANKLRGLFGR
jgi:hypothetical protein